MKRNVFLTLLCSMLFFSACGAEKTTDENEKNVVTESQVTATEGQNDANVNSQDASNSEQDEDTSLKEESVENEAANESGDSAMAECSFEYLSNYDFEFASGAGGWSTNFTIEKDGYFKGNFHDSEMGVCGDDYPDGTMYSSVFKGHFKDFTYVDDHKYEMTLADITYQYEKDSEDIIDGIKYIYTDAYGLTGSDKFYIYLPGYPLSALDEEIIMWIQWANNSEEVLTIPVIVNVNENQGIYSYERMGTVEDANATYNTYKASYDYYTEQLNQDYPQVTLNFHAKNQFDVADSCLNYLWDLVKYHTDEAGFQSILEEQRQWNSDKEAAAKAAEAQYEGGSLAPMLYHKTLAEWTIERCAVLVQYISEHAN